MAANPITITDYVNPIECVFNKYNDHLRPKELKHKSSQPILKTNTITVSNSPSRKESNNHILNQPRMRFKAKSDIERVLEERIKQNKQTVKKEKVPNYIKTEIITDNKLLARNENYEVVLDHDCSISVPLADSDVKKTKIQRVERLSHFKQKHLDKSETQMLLKLYKHNKTHFKGTVDLANSQGLFN